MHAYLTEEHEIFRRSLRRFLENEAAPHALEQQNKRYGLIAICEGGGMANSTIIERLD